MSSKEIMFTLYALARLRDSEKNKIKKAKIKEEIKRLNKILEKRYYDEQNYRT